MKHEYADCSFCGGKVTEKKIQVDYRTGDELIVFENVPAGVCGQCGEKYYTARVVKDLEQMARDKNIVGRIIHVPVKSFSEKRVI